MHLYLFKEDTVAGLGFCSLLFELQPLISKICSAKGKKMVKCSKRDVTKEKLSSLHQIKNKCETFIYRYPSNCNPLFDSSPPLMSSLPLLSSPPLLSLSSPPNGPPRCVVHHANLVHPAALVLTAAVVVLPAAALLPTAHIILILLLLHVPVLNV